MRLMYMFRDRCSFPPAHKLDIYIRSWKTAAGKYLLKVSNDETRATSKGAVLVSVLSSKFFFIGFAQNTSVYELFLFDIFWYSEQSTSHGTSEMYSDPCQTPKNVL